MTWNEIAERSRERYGEPQEAESLEQLKDRLSERHAASLLVGSAIRPSVALGRGYQTVTDERKIIGLADAQRRVPTLEIPQYAAAEPGDAPTLRVYRHDEPRISNGKPLKYEQPFGVKTRLDFSPQAREAWRRSGQTDPLFITEGQKKADALISLGIPCVSVMGVYNFLGALAQADLDALSVKGKKVCICYDSDSAGNRNVAMACDRLGNRLMDAGAEVLDFDWENDEVAACLNADGKTGIDDAIANGLRREAIQRAKKPYERKYIGDLMSDALRAEVWADQASARLRYVFDLDKWLKLRPQGTWEWCDNDDALADAREFCKGCADQMGSGVDQKAKAARQAITSMAKIRATVQLGRTLAAMRTRLEDLDADPYLLGVQNGVLDLRKGALIEDPRTALVTQRCSVRWTDFPDWTTEDLTRKGTLGDFFAKVFRGDDGTIGGVLSLLAYTLDGTTDAQKFVLLYGPRAANGKSTLVRLHGYLMGDYAMTLDNKLLLRGNTDSTRFSKHRLRGKRFIVANEFPDAQLNVDFLKEYTGGDAMRVEKKGVDEFEVKPCGVLFIFSNTLPKVRDFDAALARRTVVVPFHQSFYNEQDPEYKAGDLPRDEHMDHRLKDAAGVYLYLLVRAYQKYQQDGLLVSVEMQKAGMEFIQASDSVSSFIADRCQMGGEHSVKATDAFEEYRKYCERQGLPAKGRNQFYRDMEAQPNVSVRSTGNAKHFDGISVDGLFNGNAPAPWLTNG